MAILDRNGLTLESLQEVITLFEGGYREIYGSDISIGSDTPDGQKINNEAQQIIDVYDLLRSIFNSFDPDQATGIQLDQRVIINNITRKGGTFTQQNINITVDRDVNLDGLDTDITNIDGVGYTVADNNGTQFLLSNSISLTAGTHNLIFRAKELGAITTTPNTITTAIDIVLGVTAINNSTGVLELGVNEETDVRLRYRRDISALDGGGVRSTILNLDGVTDASYFQNRSNVTVGELLANQLWLIVEGGSDEAIATVLNQKATAGLPLKGDTTFQIVTSSGQKIDYNFDRPVSEALHLKFNIKRIVTGQTFDENVIKSAIVAGISYNIGQSAETATLTTLIALEINNNGGGGIPTVVEISKDGTNFSEFFNTSSMKNKFVLDVSNITITIL